MVDPSGIMSIPNFIQMKALVFKLHVADRQTDMVSPVFIHFVDTVQRTLSNKHCCTLFWKCYYELSMCSSLLVWLQQSKVQKDCFLRYIALWFLLTMWAGEQLQIVCVHGFQRLTSCSTCQNFLVSYIILIPSGYFSECFSVQDLTPPAVWLL